MGIDRIDGLSPDPSLIQAGEVGDPSLEKQDVASTQTSSVRKPLGVTRRAMTLGPMVLEPEAPGRFVNETKTAALTLEGQDSVVLELSAPRKQWTLKGIREGAAVFLTGEGTPLMRGEIVGLDQRGKVTLAGFDAVEVFPSPGSLPRLGLLVDETRQRFESTNGLISGVFDKNTHRLDAEIRDVQGTTSLQAKGLYQNGQALAIFPDRRVLAFRYDQPEDEALVGGPFTWLRGAIPELPPPLESYRRPEDDSAGHQHGFDASELLREVGIHPTTPPRPITKPVAATMDSLIGFLSGGGGIARGDTGRLLDSMG